MNILYLYDKPANTHGIMFSHILFFNSMFWSLLWPSSGCLRTI